VTKSRPKPSAGFSLVELLVGVTLSGAIMAAVLSAYIFVGRNFAKLGHQQTLENEARRTLIYFGDDIRMASGLTDTANLSASRISLLIPTGIGSNTITYYFNDASSAATVSINGTNVSMAANSLTRCVYNGSTVTSLTLLNNVTTAGLTLRYYDSADREYTTFTNYLSGIKQVSLEFGTRLRVVRQASGSTDLSSYVNYSGASERLLLRNQGFLP